MPLLSNPSFAAKTSLTYITAGALIDVWAGVWYSYLRRQGAEAVDSSHWYICWGLLLTGAVLVLIGILVGRIGRSARHAELPPPEVTRTMATADQSAAARGVTAPPPNPPAQAAAAPPPPGGVVASPPPPVGAPR
jgi:hypothetical protein